MIFIRYLVFIFVLAFVFAGVAHAQTAVDYRFLEVVD
jgi:hypothetical protein